MKHLGQVGEHRIVGLQASVGYAGSFYHASRTVMWKDPPTWFAYLTVAVLGWPGTPQWALKGSLEPAWRSAVVKRVLSVAGFGCLRPLLVDVWLQTRAFAHRLSQG